MEFKDLKKGMQNHFAKMSENVEVLFELDVDKDELWNLYLDSYPEGTNEIFRERREYDCSCCRHFVKEFGNVVSIKDNTITTLWDFKLNDDKFQPVLDSLSNYINSKVVSDVKISKFKKIGTNKNYEDDDGEVIEWQHFYLELPDKFVDSSSKSIGNLQGQYRDSRNVFKRSLNEITEDALLTVLELILSNTLYKGKEWEVILKEFLKHHKKYNKLSEKGKELYTWEQSTKVGVAITRIKNHSIGTLLTNISEDMDLDLAVKKYEAIVAPENYKRPKPIYTKKMLEEAKKKIVELGYMDSLNRRFAKIDDITINNVLFSNKDSAKKMNGNVFEDLESDIAINPKNFSKVDEISIKDFVNDVLSNAQSVEILLENKHKNNLVSLIAPQDRNSKTMFKWNNNFSWAYTGNITDSSMKENVKNAGGNIEGVLRFSIQWNDGDCHDKNDLDAHCIEPSGNLIYYNDKISKTTGGRLDVDIRNPNPNTPAVENIYWTNIDKMTEGKYKFLVHQFANRGGKDGFKAEIEFNGQIYSFEYNKELHQGKKIEVAEVVLKDGKFLIKEKLPSSLSSKEIWNLKTQQFVPVSIVCYSPNYWDEQQGVGHKHYLFMLKNCLNEESPNGMFNEYLNNELTPHRKVFEALTNKMRVEDAPDQLSGIGFSETKRNELIVKVKGNVERLLKIKI